MIGQNIDIKQMNKDLTLWICDVDFWKDQVENCQKTLEDSLQRIDEMEEKKKLEQFQNQIIYYRDELLDQIKHDLVVQKRLLREKPRQASQLLAIQEELGIRVLAIHEQMKERQRQIDLFINNI